MNNFNLLLNQAIVGFNTLTIDDFIAIGFILYFTSKVVGWAQSTVIRLFWFSFSIFIFYKVATLSYPLMSLPFFSAIAIFYTTFPVIVYLYKKFKAYRKKVTYVAPEVPVHKARFGYTEEEKKEKDMLERQKHKKQQEYMNTLIKKLDSF